MKNKKRCVGLALVGSLSYLTASSALCVETAAIAGSSRLTATATNVSRAQQLGMLESLLHYCGPVDSAAAASLQTKLREVAAGLSSSQLAKLRRSADYHSAASDMEKFAAQVDPHNSKRLCLQAARAGQR